MNAPFAPIVSSGWALTQAAWEDQLAALRAVPMEQKLAEEAADDEWSDEDDARDGDVFDAERWADETDRLYDEYRDRQWEAAR